MNEYSKLEKLADELREKYPPGTRIELIHMEDEFSPVEEGTRGTVRFIDDIGQMHMLWDNGRTLAVNAETDSFRALTPEECYEEQCFVCDRCGCVAYNDHQHWHKGLQMFLCDCCYDEVIYEEEMTDDEDYYEDEDENEESEEEDNGSEGNCSESESD